MTIGNDDTPSVTPEAPTVRADGGVVVSQRLAGIHGLLRSVLSTGTANDVLDLAMATAISQRLFTHGPPVWLWIEGPPSSGKTTAVNLIRGLETVGDPLITIVTKITKGSLTSGFVDKQRRRSPALIATFNGRCWVNTEFTALLSGQSDAIKETLGTLTAAFDGELPAAFGNVTEQSDTPVLKLISRFSIIGCLTSDIRQQHSKLIAQMGPRFLSYRLQPATSDEMSQAFRLVNDPERPTRLTELETLVAEHVRAVLAAGLPVEIDAGVDAILRLLANLVARGRTHVSGGYSGNDLVVGSSGEDPIRVYQQLRALTVSLTCIYGRSKPHGRVLRLVRDVALSSFEAQWVEVLLTTRTNPVLVIGDDTRHGLTVPCLVDYTGWSSDEARRGLNALVALGLYDELSDLPTVPKKPGPPTKLYVPAPGLQAVMNATFEEYPPRLVDVPRMLLDDSLLPSLSPPDARLALAVNDRLNQRVGEAVARLSQEHPGIRPDELFCRVLSEACGRSLDEAPRSRGINRVEPGDTEGV